MATEHELDVLAWTMLGEAAGEGPEGMSDVGHVVLNRLADGRYGSSIAEVAKANKQFSTWNSGAGGNNPQGRYPKNSPEFRRARELAEQVVSGAIPGPPGKPLDYHTPSISPYWADSKDRYGTYVRNGHQFYPSVPVPPADVPNAVASLTDSRRPVPMPTPVSQRPVPGFTTPSNGNNRASQAAPAYNVTPRLADMDGGLFAYRDREMQPTQMVGGFGSPLQAPRRSPQPDVAALYRGIYPQEQVRLPPLPTAARDTASRLTPSQQRADNGQKTTSSRPVPYSAGQTVASIPTTPRLPPIPSAPRDVAPRLTQAQQRADNDQVRPTPRPAAQPKPAALPSLPSPSVSAQSNINQQRSEQAAMRNRPVPTSTPVTVPNSGIGPNPVPKTQDRLVGGIYPKNPTPPAALPSLPSIGVTPRAVPPVVTPRPIQAAMPVPRPVGLGVPPAVSIPRPIRPVMPTPVAMRPPVPVARPLQRPPLNVVVTGAGTIRPPAAQVNNRYMMNGQAVQRGISNSFAGTSASGFGSDRYDRYSSTGSIAG